MGGVAISVALFAYVLSSVDLPELGRQLARTRWSWVLVSMTLGPVGLWVRSARWRYLFPPRSDPPGILAAVMIGYMANNVLPLRAGEVVRVYVVARRWRAAGHAGGHTFWLVLATLVVERVLDSLALVLILAVLVLVIPVPAALGWAAAVLVVLALVGIAALVALAAGPGRARRLVVRLTARWPSLERRAERIFDTFLLGLDGIRTRAHLLPLLAWTVVVWLVPALAAWTMLRAVHLDLPLVAAWTVLAFVGLGISIPSAPGYVGVWHAAAVLALAVFDVPAPTAVGYALLFHAGQLVPITLLGWIFLLREHVRLGEAAHARPADGGGGAGLTPAP